MSTLSHTKEQDTRHKQHPARSTHAGQDALVQKKEAGAKEEESLQMKPKAAPFLQMKCAACGGEDEQHGQTIQRKEGGDKSNEETIKGIPKAEFFSLLKERLCNDLNALFAGTPYTAINCPWIKFYVDYYSTRSAAEVEAALNRYLGPVDGDVIGMISQKAQAAVKHWLKTGEITGVPEGFSTGGDVCPDPSLQKKGSGEANQGQAREVQQKLGNGQAMSGNDASRFGQAFGSSFGDVRIHTDSTAVQLSRQMGARAFTVGNHIAFNSGEFRPGSITGDALMAHELAHVQQQRGGETSGLQSKGGSSYGALETDADNAAVGVVSKLWAGDSAYSQGIGSKTGAALRTGLQLQSCNGCGGTTTTTPKMPSIVDYKDQSKAANDPADLSDTTLKTTQEYTWLSAAYGPVSGKTTTYNDRQILMALRLMIRDLQDGLLTVPTTSKGFNPVALPYLQRGAEQLSAGTKAEASKGNFKWTPFSSGQARVDASKLNTEVGRWLLLGGKAPSGAVTVMNCWEFVMYGAYLAKVISYAELRKLYLKAKTGAGSFGDFFESELRASAVQSYNLWDPNTENPLPGDIVIFNKAAVHAAIATGDKNTIPKPGGGTHESSEVMSLWNNNGRVMVDSVAEANIEDLAMVSAGNQPVTFWSVKWNIP